MNAIGILGKGMVGKQVEYSRVSFFWMRTEEFCFPKATSILEALADYLLDPCSCATGTSFHYQIDKSWGVKFGAYLQFHSSIISLKNSLTIDRMYLTALRFFWQILLVNRIPVAHACQLILKGSLTIGWNMPDLTSGSVLPFPILCSLMFIYSLQHLQ